MTATPRVPRSSLATSDGASAYDQALALLDATASSAGCICELRRLAESAPSSGDPYELAIAAIEATEADPICSARAVASVMQRAGRTDEAVERLVAAGRRLEVTLDIDGAVEMFELAAAVPGLDPAVSDDVLARAARALAAIPTHSGNARRARIWRLLMQRARQRGDRHAAARAAYHASSCDPDVDEPTELLTYAATLGEDGWPACARARLAEATGEFEEAATWSRRALGMARRTGDLHLESIALEGLGYAAHWLGRLDDAMTHLRASVAASEVDGDIAGALMGRGHLVEVFCQLLRLDDAARECAHLRQLVPADRAPGWRSFAAAFESRVQSLRGDVSGAARLARDADDPFTDGGTTVTDLVMLLIRATSMLDAGELVPARDLADVARQVAERLEIDGFRHMIELLELCIAASADEVTIAEAGRAATTQLEGADPWVRASAARWITWRACAAGDVHAARSVIGLVTGITSDDGPLPFLLARTARAASDAIERSDDRPLRVVARAWDAAGAAVEGARCRALVALTAISSGDRATAGDAARTAHRIAAELEAAGALPDADAIVERLAAAVDDPDADGMRDGFESHRLLASASHAERTELARLAKPIGGYEDHAPGVSAGDVVMVTRGALRVDDEDGLLLVAGAGSATYVPSGTNGAVLVRGFDDTTMAWVIDGRTFDVWCEQLTPELRTTVAALLERDSGSVVGRSVDPRAGAHQRVVGVLAALDHGFGIAEPEGSGQRIVPLRLTQSDIGELAATSRKSATLVASRLRAAGIADVKRGRIVVLDPHRLGS